MRRAAIGLLMGLPAIVVAMQALPAGASESVVSVPQQPVATVFDMKIDSQRGPVFVAGAHTVSMFDAASGRLRYTTEVGAAPVAMAVDDSTGRLSVDLSQDGMRALDASSGRILRSVAGVPGEVLLAMVATAAGARALVVDPAAW